MQLKGSKTEKNLATAFAGESQARNKYDYFASRAKKDGFEQFAAIFAETALNEKEHAKLWLKRLGGIGDTPANLAAAAAGEQHHEERYRKLLENIEKGEVFVKIGPNRWQCRNCGHIYVGEKAPELCPVCSHPKAYFQIEAENY